ncbi:Serine/threonine-protein kinase SSN3 [Rhizopus microsporus ATCC 52813]|uniref:Cyclin-dependent kinase 8 n=1 Tax=Rhizopus microsporus ATCC 52813 TaxID=1340429 RepID=A0A2G4T3Z4_RHIZD|nr:Serine/threonine-protein kinase SSN3 [Rhizopus microsporus ATCC 52813]PHZ15406.1 Serine/threonine-protein kinase SSN3 [Rhizopus microsporus ATCC 52813]
MIDYKKRKDARRPKVLDKYEIIGFISSGTYGRVYKARSRNKDDPREFAIKKFKPDREGDTHHYVGISQSACREIALCRELRHENVVALEEVLLEDKAIFMVFEYAEHDFLQIIHHHLHAQKKPIPEIVVKSLLWQLINGVAYLHANWVLHRDLKPANVLLTSDGVVKTADLGLARLFNKPLAPLFNGDKVVVTIWYRAPELLFGARHYTKAVDMWAVGCIFGELLALKPIFKGEEAKIDNKKSVPFQRSQLTKIIEVMGTPTKERWPSIDQLPDYPHLASFPQCPNNLKQVYQMMVCPKSESAFNLLSALLEYDPAKRITAEKALNHPYFQEDPKPIMNVLAHQNIEYPLRRITHEDNDIKSAKAPAKEDLHASRQMKKPRLA